MRRSRIPLTLFALIALSAPVIAHAQEDTATSATVAIGEFDFPTNAKEPLQGYIVARSTLTDGTFVTVYYAAQLADGTFTGLTPCDNLAVLCQPVIQPAKAAYALADPSDVFVLAKETTGP